MRATRKGWNIKTARTYTIKNGNLKKSHPYYTQIQLTAWATGAKYANLFLFVDNDCKFIYVPLDFEFI